MDLGNLAFFARNGFLHERGLVSAEACEQMVRWTQERLPFEWDVERPESWVGPIQDACHSNTLVTRRGRVQFAGRDLADEPLIVSSYGPTSPMAKIARGLIGSELAPVLLRGLYPIFPIALPADFNPFKKGHNEAHPSQLVTVTYLRDVEPGGGALLIWPGSHRAIYPAMGSKLEFAASADYDRVFGEWTSKEPIELHGRRGDVIILHHRLMHAASVNCTDEIRYAFLTDYRRADYLELCKERPSTDLWEDWPAMRALGLDELSAAPDFALASQPHAFQPVDFERKLKQRISPEKATTKRKGDASILERSRAFGDRWLVLSDAKPSVNDWKLYPRGGDLSAQGTQVHINGVKVPSVCQFDYIVKMSTEEKIREIKITKLRSRAWIRVLLSRLPFSDSDIEVRVELQPGRTVLTFDDFPNGLTVEHRPSVGLRINPAWLRRAPSILRSLAR